MHPGVVWGPLGSISQAVTVWLKQVFQTAGPRILLS